MQSSCFCNSVHFEGRKTYERKTGFGDQLEEISSNSEHDVDEGKVAAGDRIMTRSQDKSSIK
jgi:hypothetical protein